MKADNSEPLPSKSSPLTRIPPLDGLRGIALMIVLCRHTYNSGPKEGLSMLENSLLYLPQLMWSGVDLFFVLSGFLITSVLVDRKGKPSFFRNFYARRVLRLAPVYYCVLISAQLISWIFGWRNLVPSKPEQLLLYYLNLANIAIFIRGGWGPCIAVAWSLSIEEQFYACWSVLVFFCSQVGIAVATILIITLSPLLRWFMIERGINQVLIYTSPVSHLDGLAWGALISVLWRQGLLRKPIALWCTLVVLVASLVMTALFVQHNVYAPTMKYSDMIPVVALGYSAVLILVLRGNWTTFPINLLNHSALQLIGKHSYAMYLVHQFVITILRPSFPFTEFDKYPASSLLRNLGWTGSVFVLSLLISITMWHLFEKRFQDMKARFE